MIELRLYVRINFVHLIVEILSTSIPLSLHKLPMESHESHFAQIWLSIASPCVLDAFDNILRLSIGTYTLMLVEYVLF